VAAPASSAVRVVGGRGGGWRARIGKRVDVGHAREVPGRVGVGPRRAAEGVGHAQGDSDVRHPTPEHPEVAIDGATVEHLRQQLHVAGREEPEPPGVVGERRRRRRTLVAVRRLPIRLEREPAVRPQTQLAAPGDASRAEAMREHVEMIAGDAGAIAEPSHHRGALRVGRQSAGGDQHRVHGGRQHGGLVARVVQLPEAVREVAVEKTVRDARRREQVAMPWIVWPYGRRSAEATEAAETAEAASNATARAMGKRIRSILPQIRGGRLQSLISDGSETPLAGVAGLDPSVRTALPLTSLVADERSVVEDLSEICTSHLQCGFVFGRLNVR
jgi:hypothetical protein